jgi:hypothetical protein
MNEPVKMIRWNFGASYCHKEEVQEFVYQNVHPPEELILDWRMPSTWSHHVCDEEPGLSVSIEFNSI